MRRLKPTNKLVRRNGRWFENGRYLPKKDYIFHSDAHDGESIISCITGQKYKLSDERMVTYI